MLSLNEFSTSIPRLFHVEKPWNFHFHQFPIGNVEWKIIHGKAGSLIDQPMSATEIVKAAYAECNIPRRRAFELLAELKNAGLLRQPQKRGKYEAV